MQRFCSCFLERQMVDLLEEKKRQQRKRETNLAHEAKGTCASRVYILYYIYNIYIHIPCSHSASLLGVPCTFTALSSQGSCGSHSVLASLLALNVPSGQGSHFASFPKSAGTNFSPAGHFGSVTNTMHGVIRGTGGDTRTHAKVVTMW